MMDGLAATWLVGSSAALGAGALAAHTWLIGQVAGRQGRLARRLNTIETRLTELLTQPSEAAPAQPVAAVAPDFTLMSTTGTTVGLDDLRARGKPVMMLFAEPASTSGQELLPLISRWQATHGDPLTVVVVARDGPDRGALTAPPGGVAAMVLQPQAAVSHLYGVRFAPGVVLIRPNGVLAGPAVYGVGGIQRLLDALATAVEGANAQREARARKTTPAIGTLAPAVILPGLDGVDREVSDTGDEPTVLLFWNPRCGYCTQLRNDLHAWEGTLPASARRLTILARGSAEENRAEGFQTRLLLDEDLAASSAFGVTSTPSAIVLDARGVVVSPLARGIREVRALLGLDNVPDKPV